MAVYLIKPNAACTWLKSSHATYLTARAGANLAVQADGLLSFGQEANSPYQCWQSFLDFDTRSVQGTILEAKIAWFSAQSMNNLQAFIAQVRAHDYGGGAPTTDDWVPGASINASDHPIFATQTGNIIQSVQGQTATPYRDCCFVTAEGGESLINVGGYTRFIVVSDKFVDGTPSGSSYYTSSGSMHLATAGLEPVLILYTTASGPPVITTWRSRWNSGSTLTLYEPGGITPSTVMFAFKTGSGSSSDGRQSGENWAGVHYQYGGASSVCNVGLDWKLAETKDVDLTNASYAFTAGTGGASFGVLFGVLGLDLDEDIIGAHSLAIDAVSNVDVLGTAIETSAAQRALLMGIVSDDGAYSASGYQIATDNPASWQEGFDVGYSTTRQLAHALGVKPLAGSTGTPQATLSSASMGILSLVELTPKVFIEWTTTSISINGGAASTDDNDVALSLSAVATLSGSPVTVDKMRFSEDGVTWGEWENYATSRAYQLPAQDDEDPHTCTVYVQFRATSEGTTYTSDAVSDAITLQIDWTDLSVYLEVVTLNDGMPVAGVTEVPLTFGGTSSAGDVVQYCYAIDGGAAVAWGTYVPDLSRPYHPMSITVELGTTGEHYVDVYLKDDDDNTLLIGRDDVLITDKTTIDYTRPFGVIPVRMYADSSQVRKMSHDIEAPNLLPVRIPTSAKRRR